MRRERIFLLHFLWMAEVILGGIILPVCEDGVAEDILTSLMIFDGESQLDV